jgi:hypothetical protein
MQNSTFFENILGIKYTYLLLYYRYKQLLTNTLERWLQEHRVELSYPQTLKNY